MWKHFLGVEARRWSEKGDGWDCRNSAFFNRQKAGMVDGEYRLERKEKLVALMANIIEEEGSANR
jgi:hypothetical protein